jgi:enoyl-CoA hydratase/carnithine racemase
MALVTTEVDGHVLSIGINRPDKRNAVNMALLRELAMAYGEYDRDERLRAAVLFGHGEHFCAGLELAEAADAMMSPLAPSFVPEGGLDPWGILTPRLSKPLIVAVRGYALTLAIELCLAADIVVAGDDAKFAQLEVSRGIFPFGGATVRWPLASGYQNAMRYLLTGDMFDAVEARRIGLVQDVIPAGEALEHARDLARKIARHAPLGVHATLATARHAQNHGQLAGKQALYPEIRRLYASEDAKLGIRTFLDRQRPDFAGV